MKIYSSDQVRRIDAYTIENEPIASIDLMERASRQIADWIASVFSTDIPLVFLIGPGNNGGDGLASARMLSRMNYLVSVFLVRISGKLSADCQTNLERLPGNVPLTEIKDKKGLEGLSKYLEERPSAVLLDALFGSGLSRPVEGLAGELIRRLNEYPQIRVSIDMPSGLFGEDNRGNNPDAVVRADFTLALQAPSLSFFFAENQENTGMWEVLPIGLHPDILEKEATPYYYLTAEYLAGLLHTRRKFDHKGKFGHGLLIAGCYGMMGAVVLAARACLRSGIGLVTSHIPRFGYPIVQTSVPESLISLDESDILFSGIPDLGGFSAVGAGPGLGCKPNTAKALRDLVEKTRIPMVIDADALNILAGNPEWLSLLPENTILTPHPREFDRLSGKPAGEPAGYLRHLEQLDMAAKHKVIVVLKGACTSIAFPDGTCWFNTTGNPGMATAGSGDVLTGIILSLLGQGYPPGHAALLGVYLHGLAGDLAAELSSEESLIAGDIIESLGRAFKYLKEPGNDKDH